MSLWGSIKKAAKKTVTAPVSITKSVVKAPVKTVQSLARGNVKGAVTAAVSPVKTVAKTTVSTTRAVAGAAKTTTVAATKTAAKTTVAATKAVVKAPISTVKAVARGDLKGVVKAAAAPVTAAAKPIVTATKPAVAAVVSAQQAAGARLTSGLKTMHLTSVANQLDIKKLVTDPKGYAKDMVSGYGQDISDGGQVISEFKSGNFKALGQEAFGDTVKAFGGSDAQAAAAAKIGEQLGGTYQQLKGIKPKDEPPTASQLTGDPMPPQPYYTTPPTWGMPGPAGAPSGRSAGTMLLVGGGALVAVLVIVLAARA